MDDDRPPLGAAAADNWHAMPVDAVLERLNARAAGLDDAMVAERRARWGLNSLPHRPPPSILTVFLRQFRSPLIYLLLAAAAVSLVIGDRIDALFILVVLLLNAAIGTTQESRAGASAEALRSLIRQVARVRRDGRVTDTDAALLVPGDIVLLETGMRVPADLRLIEDSGLAADESLLTGESLPASKSATAIVPQGAPLGDRTNMLHAGTMIAGGRGTGVIVATGSRTALGVIAASLADPLAAPPPLMLRLHQLSRQIAVGAIGLILLLGLVLALQGVAADRIFLLAIALAVSAIPEGLPVAVTVALASATRRMARRHVIVRALPAVEGLGACTLIASDKTGTLTVNQLTVERLLMPDGSVIDRSGWIGGVPSAPVMLAVRAAALCNEASLSPEGEPVGDSVDVSLIRFAREAGSDVCNDPRIALLPYEPANRFAAVAVNDEEGVAIFAKGAVETIAAMCDGVDSALLAEAEALACHGYRVLALAHGRAAPDRVPDLSDLHGLQLVGCVALMDPLRPEAADAIRRCAEAGIKVRMITGDHPSTALTIARQLGLASDPAQVVTGSELAALAGSPADVAARIAGAVIFARIEPQQKLMIVEALAASGEIVAVTGDGVNDAPALEAAHIGVAMGKGGTDVAREAADLILTDDNFASIVAGVEEGRITYANIRKIVVFLLATGVAEIAMFLGALLAGLPMPLTPVQLLWLNLVTNGAQDVMLGFGRGEGDELQRRPRNPRAPLIDGHALGLMIPPALVMTLFALLLFDRALNAGASLADAQNAILLLMVLFQNAFVLSIRSERRPIFRAPFSANPWLLVGVLAALLLHVAAMHFGPLRAVLGTSPVDERTLGLCLAGMAGILLVSELAKYVLARIAR